MTTQQPPEGPGGATPSEVHPKRSREEIERLARKFVTAHRTLTITIPALRRNKAMQAIGSATAVVAILGLAVFFWPRDQRTERMQDPALAQVLELQKRAEEERARAQQELDSSKEYMARIAAADAARLKDMQERAEALAESAEPEPAAASKKAAAPAPSTKVAVASSTPANASGCRIHVSQLSGDGKLTYEQVKAMPGARFDPNTSRVFTPPVKTAGGKSVIFEILPTGCVQLARGPIPG